LNDPVALEWLGLQEDGGAAFGVEGGGSEQRGSMYNPGKWGSSGLNPVKCESLLAGRGGNG
jgi:hypothetical protein